MRVVVVLEGLGALFLRSLNYYPRLGGRRRQLTMTSTDVLAAGVEEKLREIAVVSIRAYFCRGSEIICDTIYNIFDNK